MSIQVFGTPVSRGVAIGRAVLVASSRVDVAHYFVATDRIEPEIDRLRQARDAVAVELGALKTVLPPEAPHELAALLDVHLMLLHDEALIGATKAWIMRSWPDGKPSTRRSAPNTRAVGREGSETGSRSAWSTSIQSVKTKRRHRLPLNE